MNLTNRLKAIQSAIAARSQQKTNQIDAEQTAAAQARAAAMSYEELIAEYESAWKTPPTDPRLIAELAKLDGMNADELISHYMSLN